MEKENTYSLTDGVKAIWEIIGAVNAKLDKQGMKIDVELRVRPVLVPIAHLVPKGEFDAYTDEDKKNYIEYSLNLFSKEDIEKHFGIAI